MSPVRSWWDVAMSECGRCPGWGQAAGPQGKHGVVVLMFEGKC